jgi:hypothetical protein
MPESNGARAKKTDQDGNKSLPKAIALRDCLYQRLTLGSCVCRRKPIFMLRGAPTAHVVSVTNRVRTRSRGRD